MTGLLLPLVLLGCGVAMSLATGFALHRLAPAAGYVSEVERRDFRNFGFEWGWLTPLPALLYWFTEVWKFHAPPTAAAPVEFGAQSAAELSTTLARRRRRLAAWAIDIGWILTAWSISLLLFRSIGWAIGAEDGTLLLLLGLWLASCVPISMAYATLFLARRGDHNGQTPGKRAVGVRVVRRDGQELTLANAARREIVGRHLPGLVTGVILYGVIDGGWCLFDERKQTLHDRIGATIVVSAR